MPIYEYTCSACGHQLEAMQSISEPPLRQCPKCRRRSLKKLVSAAGFVLKGTGWYVTDFRDKKKGKSEKKEKVETEAASDKKPDGAKKDDTAKEATKATEKANKPKSAGADA
jgi:putative FmdB family regulatory protein